MIDIHCHILPKVDDGPTSWDTSLEMCRMAAADGIEHIVATPHANERFHYNRHDLASNLEYLKGLVGPTPRLSLGCDFHLSYDNLQVVIGKMEIAAQAQPWVGPTRPLRYSRLLARSCRL